MANVPSFQLNASNIDFESDEALQQELAKTGGKFFDTPGNVDLTISAAVHHANKETGEIFCAGDKTWFNVKLTLSSTDGKEVDHWLQVPTTSIKFGKKQTLALFRKLQEFFFAIGETVTIAKLNNLLQKYFADPSKLVGQKVNVDLGYEGPYVAKADNADEYLVMVKGQPLKDEGTEVRLPDRSSAIQYAKSQGIEPSFLRVVKFTARKTVKPLKAASADW